MNIIFLSLFYLSHIAEIAKNIPFFYMKVYIYLHELNYFLLRNQLKPKVSFSCKTNVKIYISFLLLLIKRGLQGAQHAFESGLDLQNITFWDDQIYYLVQEELQKIILDKAEKEKRLR